MQSWCYVWNPGRTKKGKRQESTSEDATTIELDIAAVDSPTVDVVKRQLQEKIDQMVAKPVAVISDQFIAKITSECQRDILSLEFGADVEITVGV